VSFEIFKRAGKIPSKGREGECLLVTIVDAYDSCDGDSQSACPTPHGFFLGLSMYLAIRIVVF
jgi:hypothetical protein